MATILVVDDDEDIRQVATYFLESDGHKVVTADNGAQALPMAAQNKPEVIVLDLMMPEMSGATTLEMLSDYRKANNAGVILLTASPDKGLIRRATTEPDVRYLPKPTSKADLIFAVRELLLLRKPR
jgi:CheY-like chemotaxis protein